jgi:hypothetical protein
MDNFTPVSALAGGVLFARPGPALTALSSLNTGVLVFVGAMIAGGAFARIAFQQDRVLSSVVEHFLHTEGATGSNPVAPTKFLRRISLG